MWSDKDSLDELLRLCDGSAHVELDPNAAQWLREQIEGMRAVISDLLLRNRLLRDRPDLPLERLQAYDELIARLDHDE